MIARVRIEGTVYLLDVITALAVGLLQPEKPKTPPILGFRVGDVFTFPNSGHSNVVIVQLADEKYALGGRSGLALRLWNVPSMDYTGTLAYLNNQEAVFKKNINTYLE